MSEMGIELRGSKSKYGGKRNAMNPEVPEWSESFDGFIEPNVEEFIVLNCITIIYGRMPVKLVFYVEGSMAGKIL